MNAVFKSLGYKVFDYFEILDYAKYFNAYGKGNIVKLFMSTTYIIYIK